MKKQCFVQVEYPGGKPTQFLRKEGEIHLQSEESLMPREDAIDLASDYFLKESTGRQKDGGKSVEVFENNQSLYRREIWGKAGETSNAFLAKVEYRTENKPAGFIHGDVGGKKLDIKSEKRLMSREDALDLAGNYALAKNHLSPEKRPDNDGKSVEVFEEGNNNSLYRREF